MDQQVRDLATDRLARRELAIAATGLLALGMGIGSIVRRSLLQGPRGQDEEATGRRRGPFGDLAGEIWALAETMAFSFFRLLLVAYVYVVAVQVLQGEQPSGDLIAQAIERTMAVILTILDEL